MYSIMITNQFRAPWIDRARCHVTWGAFQGDIGSSIARVLRVVEGTGTAEGVDATEGACACAAGGARARGAGTTSKSGGGANVSRDPR